MNLKTFALLLLAGTTACTTVPPKQEASVAPRQHPPAEVTIEGNSAAELQAYREAVSQAFDEAEPKLTAALTTAMTTADAWIPSPADSTVFGQSTWHGILDVYRTVRRSSLARVRTANKYGIQSIGNVADGVMVGSTTLPLDGPNYHVMKVQRKRHTNYGTKPLVNLVSDTADFVAGEHPGAVLMLGNMANKYGGDFIWSVSHNTGRDVDIFYYIKSKETGKQVFFSTFKEFNEDGTCKKDRNILFDVPRNWSLVKGILSNKSVTIQRLFISTGLRQMLLDYAKEKGEPEWLQKRAEAVIIQPVTSRPHNDHLHVRIACPGPDRLFGCIDFGPQFPWGNWHLTELRREAVILSRAFADPAATRRDKIDILSMLETINSPHMIEVALIFGIRDKDPKVVHRALDLLNDNWASGQAVTELAIKAINEISDSKKSFKIQNVTKVDYLTALYAVLRKTHLDIGWAFATEKIRNPATSESERMIAITALRHSTNPERVKELIDLLPSQPPAVANAISDTLAYMTMRDDGVNFRRSGTAARKQAIAGWQAWWHTHGNETNDTWRHDGIAAELHLKTLAPPQFNRLIDQLRRTKKDYVLYNISRYLTDHTKFGSAYEGKKRRQLYDTWERWWRHTGRRECRNGSC